METATLTEFLLARIAEDEAAAKRDIEEGVKETQGSSVVWAEGYVSPVRALAECAAKRRILDTWQDPDAVPEGERETYFKALGIDQCVRLLAQVYSDHPDYREEWGL